jgi:hypothetical protein
MNQHTIVSASFLWKNNEPGGLGFTFAPPGFTPKELTEMFSKEHLDEYKRKSDLALGTNVVKDYLAQLEALGEMKQLGRPISLQLAIMAALNIIWLVDRGFIPNDEFNGVQYVYAVP